MKHYARGFSSLEITLFLFLATLITLAALSGAEVYKRRGDKQQVMRHVDILLAAGLSYYQSHCNDAVIADPTLTVLKAENFIDTIPLNPLGEQYTVSVLRSPMPLVEVQASINLLDVDQQIAFFGANSFNGGRLSWLRSLRTSSSNVNQHSRTHRSMYEGECV